MKMQRSSQQEGSLPSCMQRVWTTDKRGGYHAEYGYSCMGYEVAAALGVKLAEPDNGSLCSCWRCKFPDVTQ